MKKEKGIRKFGWARAFVVFWLGLLGIGYFPTYHLLGLLFLLSMLYVIFMDPINDKYFDREAKEEKKEKAETEAKYDAEAFGKPIKCPFCGEKIPSEIKYCYFCGKPLETYKKIEAIRLDSLARIKKAADDMGDDAKKADIMAIRDLTDKILRKYEETPEQKSDSKKFTDYYHPKSIAAIEHYQVLCSLQNLGSGEDKIKDQLADSIDMIKEAFTNIFNRASTEGIYDLSADVSALEQVLQLDGLTDSDFEA